LEDKHIRIARRGYDEQDLKWFSETELKKLLKAQEEVLWLMDRGYKMDSVINFIGSHYQLASRQRIALQRGTSSTLQCINRKEKLIPIDKINEKSIFIDGFNLIITLEVALSNGTLIYSNDGTIRDLAGLRGTYRLIDKTYKAIEILGRFFKDLKIKEVIFYFDSPVSNSGRLKQTILEYFKTWDIKIQIEFVNNADPILESKERVITSDSIILDKCISWFNVTGYIIENYIQECCSIYKFNTSFTSI